MNKTFAKFLINFAMIQSVLLATSVGVGLQLPNTSGGLISIAFVYMILGGLSLIPSLGISALVALLQK